MIEEVNKTAPEDRSVSELVTDMTDQVKRLVRDELRLAASELERKGKRLGTGAGLFGAAGIIALFGLATFVAAAVLALSLAMDGWLAAVLVGVVLLVAAGIAGLVGKKQVKRATPPVPEEAMSGQKKDFPSTDDDLRLDRDVTRQELGDTVQALAHKLDVKARVKDGVDEKLDQATAKVADVVSPPAAERLRQGADAVRANPLPVFGALLALLVAIRFATRHKKD
jgi:uncharacterized membrane protein YqjE